MLLTHWTDENAIIQARRSKLVKNIPESSATHYKAFRVIRSNIAIAITLPQIARSRSNLIKSFITSQAMRCKFFKSNDLGKGHGVK